MTYVLALIYVIALALGVLIAVSEPRDLWLVNAARVVAGVSALLLAIATLT